MESALEPAFHIDRVILYSSYAHNRADEWSDIDVAVVSPDFEGMSPLKVVDEIATRRIHFDSRISSLAYTPVQFDNAPPYFFAAEIRRTGKLIYDARRTQKARKTVGRRKMTMRRRNGKTKAQAG